MTQLEQTDEQAVRCRRLEGQVAVVSGAASGMGRAIACRLASEGASVVWGDIRHAPDEHGFDGDQPTEAVIAAAGGEARYIEWDVRDADQTQQAVRFAEEQYGRLDIVVASAGIHVTEGELLQESADAWQRHIDVNLTGVWNTIRFGLRSLVDQGRGGRIVALSSQSGLLGYPGAATGYVATKAGVLGLIRQTAVNGGPHGITANAVCPGIVRTSMSHLLWEHPEMLAGASAAYPLRRLGEPSDIAAAVAFLASPDASWITGVSLPVDGGVSCI